MPKFEAQGIVEALDYDFAPYVQASGTIPEPTDNQIARFLSESKKLVDDVRKDLPEELDPTDTAAVIAAMDKLDPEDTIRQMGEMCEIYARLCSNTPTSEQIHSLPMRVRSIFFAWLQGEVMAPEAASPGGNATVRALPAARGA